MNNVTVLDNHLIIFRILFSAFIGLSISLPFVSARHLLLGLSHLPLSVCVESWALVLTWKGLSASLTV